jgi:hypothetical protein
LEEIMNPVRNHASGPPLANIQDLSVLVDAGSGSKAADSLTRTTLKLPAGGNYWAELRGGQLHIYEAESGVCGWSFGERSECTNVTLDDGLVRIGVSGIGVSEIVLHLAPQTHRGSLRSLEELDMPVDLLDRYAELRAKGSLTVQEMHERRDLLEKIRAQFRRVDDQRESRQSCRSSTSSSGESCRSVGGSG